MKARRSGGQVSLRCAAHPAESKSIFQDGKETWFIVELQINLEPRKIERRNCPIQVFRAVDAILFCGHQHFGAMHASLMRDPLQFDGPVVVMIIERPSRDNFKAEGLKRIPEVLWVTHPAERRNAASR